ncbi:DNA-directed RNA polymerase subunit H [archaeon]|nr:DNA-directed RNA polymerase subunit H [archaeon]
MNINHVLIPLHEIVPKDQVPEILSKYGTELKNLPRILGEDPVVESLGAVKGDLIKISRNSMTAGKSVYFRVVV